MNVPMVDVHVKTLVRCPKAVLQRLMMQVAGERLTLLWRNSGSGAIRQVPIGGLLGPAPFCERLWAVRSLMSHWYIHLDLCFPLLHSTRCLSCEAPPDGQDSPSQMSDL